LTLALATTVLVGCGHEPAELAEAESTPLEVHVAAVEVVAEGKPIEVYGIVQPAQQAAVSSRVVGPVVALDVQAGATVRRGAGLLRIQPEAVEGQVAQAQGALAQAQAALALAERNFQRYQALHDERAASDVELDMARMQHEQAEGAVRQAEGALQSVQSIADEAVVRAPFDARVVNTLVEVGDLAAPGRPLVQVESLAGRQIWLSVRAADIGRLAVGDGVGVRLDHRTDLGEMAGRVAEIVPAADPSTHTFTVKVDLGDVQAPSGLSGRARMPGDVIERLVVPRPAVHHRGGLQLVLVRADDGTSRTRAVTTGGELDGDRIEVLSGLSAGDTVVVDAAAPVADGTPLEVVP
jgi:RND family efflux transporter MFP subunit